MTPPDVRKKRSAAIKEGMAIIEDVVKGYTKLFEKAIEFWTSLQEDPTMQKIGEDIKEIEAFR